MPDKKKDRAAPGTRAIKDVELVTPDTLPDDVQAILAVCEPGSVPKMDAKGKPVLSKDGEPEAIPVARADMAVAMADSSAVRDATARWLNGSYFDDGIAGASIVRNHGKTIGLYIPLRGDEDGSAVGRVTL